MRVFSEDEVPAARARLARHFTDQQLDKFFRTLFPPQPKPYDIKIPADEAARQRQEGPPPGATR